MLAQAHLFFVDVQFFEVEDHLLLEAVLVQFHLQVLRSLADAFAHGVQALRLVRFHLVVQREDRLHAGGHVGVQGGAFPDAEGIQGVQRLLQSGLHEGPFLFGNRILPAPFEHVGEAQDGLQVFFLGHRDTHLAADGVDLAEVVLHQGGVDAAGGGAGLGLEVQQQVHGTALQPLGERLAHFQFPVLRQERRLDGHVAVFPVQGTDFEGETPRREFGHTFAVAGHGFNHILFALGCAKLRINP